ncbi:uncharacterized protein FFUJ_10387 [Fusarium fujikuroi IMI 58289]|uniref:Uncharacterized protein n=1 Tax=Gibberella fujikuroi (strain CBS 195.34 / IMI 58289 / NRRL A-6831) TaxID=1279085 RepID=S0EHS4_GIBF5|nr:uncharacterized protein FFUJ_10387 [Fusarium fujikuroi IMI 58289]KLP15757.1 uncharacterized protein LW94_9014 [Fusarium fujikuroi]CCT74339.1 uncharacterized protein FFUJ_10387 [Fusarium fujikuroi IMI 58289]SCO26264.1 uncharacterized protein FFM5_14540 [Fusarium fujikuroi]SCO58362.1 uncharacterized protein FFMR_15518 [Fusarium fujikuroi]
MAQKAPKEKPVSQKGKTDTISTTKTDKKGDTSKSCYEVPEIDCPSKTAMNIDSACVSQVWGPVILNSRIDTAERMYAREIGCIVIATDSLRPTAIWLQ